MFKKLVKNRKAQNTAEYALLISLVIAAVIAMQTYAQRSIQAKIKDAASMNYGAQGFVTQQYEPYYLQSNYEISRTGEEGEALGVNLVQRSGNTQRSRATSGFQASTYDTVYGLVNGL